MAENDPNSRIMSFDTTSFTKHSKHSKQHSKYSKQHKRTPTPAVADLSLTAFQRERVFLEFDSAHPSQINTDIPSTGTLTITNPSQDTAYVVVTFDDQRSDDSLNVVPGTLKVPANGKADVTVSFRPVKPGSFRGKLYFKTSSRLRLEVTVTGAAVGQITNSAISSGTTSSRTARHVASVKSKKMLTRHDHHVPGETKAPLDPKLQKILHSCGQLGVPVVHTKRATQPEAFELSTSRRVLTVVDDVPEQSSKIAAKRKIRASTMKTKTSASSSRDALQVLHRQRADPKYLGRGPASMHTKHTGCSIVTKHATKRRTKLKENQHRRPVITAAAAAPPPKRLKLQRRSTKMAPPTGSTNSLRTKAVVRSRHAQIRRVLYDENWAEKQTAGFTAYMNAVFYPAEDSLSSNKDSSAAAAADAATSTAAVVAPGGGAPAAANDYFRTLLQTQRQASIRRRAFRIYQSRDMDDVCFAIDKEVASGHIAVRKDRELHADLGLRKRVMDLLFCYHPVWLRLGLETVFGEIIPMRSSSEHDAGCSVLRRFMRERLLQDPDTCLKFKTTKNGTFGKGYAEQSAKLTLRRFLMVVLFLDRAKQSTLPETIEGGPCLFNKASPFKQSRDIVVSFAKEFLSGEGNVNRHLSLLGYEVTYKQSILDEVDYTVKELAVELRDGVRLCRMVELLCPSYGRELSLQLRMPAGSRLQKKHNVTLALAAMKKEGISLSGLGERGVRGDITTDDIVNGHCEKTLALLWRTFAQCRLESGDLISKLLLQEEIVRVRDAHSVSATKFETDQIEADEIEEREASGQDQKKQKSQTACSLLEWARAVCAGSQLRVPVQNFTTSFADGRALCALLNFYHPQLLSTGDMQTTTADLAIKKGKSKKSGSSSTFSATEMWCPELLSSGDISQVEYQRCLEGERHNFVLFNKSIQLIGSVPPMLGVHDTDHLPEEKTMVIVLAHVCARVLQSSKEIHACMRIQAYWRRSLAARQQLKRNAAGRTILRIFRRSSGINWFHHFRAAVVSAQAVVRGRIAFNRFLRLKTSMISLQCHHRRQKAWSDAANERIVLHVLSSCAKRAHQLRQQYYSRKREWASSLIYALVLGFCARKEYAVMRAAAVSIQRCARRITCNRAYGTAQSSVVVLQSFARMISNQSAYAMQVKAVVLVQSVARMLLASKSTARVSSAVVSLQCSFRCRQAAKEVAGTARRKFAAQTRGATSVQAAFRGHVARTERHQMHTAATSLQTWLRGCVASFAYGSVKRAAVVCQALLRRNIVKSQYESFCNAVVALQCAARSRASTRNLQMRRTLWNKLQHDACVVIQSTFRRHLATRAYLTTQHACTQIQSFLRMHRQVMGLQLAVRSAVSIQGLFRTVLAASALAKKKSAAVTIQSAWRCHTICSNFHQLAVASVMVQSFVRRVQVRVEYTATLKAVTVMQCAVRVFASRCALMSLQQKKNAQMHAATKISSTLRGRIARARFVVFLTAVVQIQSLFRRRQTRTRFQSLVVATTALQAHARRKVVRNNIWNKNQQASRVQASIRRHLQRQEFGRAKRAAIRIQCARRCIVSRATYKFMRSTVLVQRCARRWMAMVHLSRARYSCVVVQSHIRMRFARLSHLNKTLISTRVAALQRSRSQRANYVQFRSTVISLQAGHRTQIAKRTLHTMKMKKAHDIAHQRSMEKSARKIQRAFRNMVLQRKEQTSASLIQKNVRALLKIRRHARIQRSIGFVQAFWRGCVARSRSSSLLSNARERVKSANANAQEDMKLGNRTSVALRVLLESKALSEVFEAIKTLEVSTRLSSVCCSCFAQETGAIQTIYGLIRSCNRSQPHRKLLLHALRVLNNVWPFEMKVARGRNATIAPGFGPRMDILVDLMQVCNFFSRALFWMPSAACCHTAHMSESSFPLPSLFFILSPLCFFFFVSFFIHFSQMFRDKLPTFKLACRLARWLCTDPERAATCKSNKDTMKRLTSIHAVLSRKAKMSTHNNHGKATKSCPASHGAVAIASLLHCIKDNAL